MELNSTVACICEGNAERAIMDLLLENNLLIFNEEQLLDGEIIRCRNGKKFESRYLNKRFKEKITVLRILDSRRENFKLSKAYQHQVDVINIITAPEIEILIILCEDKYKEFNKSGLKPSEYCKATLKMKDVKSGKTVRDYFKDIEKLKFAIQKYKQIKKVKKGEKTLLDLLRNI
ncbi:MAG: hypothetical protein N4A40_13335 [Tissierellales bacterium]|jgi:hypothetical protein|nr:hypothetical protein [Tissierellales bacterium]